MLVWRNVAGLVLWYVSNVVTSTSNLVISAFHWKNSCTAPPKSLAASLEEKLCLSPARLHVTRNFRTSAPGASADSSVSGVSTFVSAAAAAAGGRSGSSVVASSPPPLGLGLEPFPPFRNPFFFLKERFSFQTSRAFVHGSLEASSCNSFSVSSWTDSQRSSEGHAFENSQNKLMVVTSYLWFFKTVMIISVNHDKQVVHRPQEMNLQEDRSAFSIFRFVFGFFGRI